MMNFISKIDDDYLSLVRIQWGVIIDLILFNYDCKAILRLKPVKKNLNTSSFTTYKKVYVFFTRYVIGSGKLNAGKILSGDERIKGKVKTMLGYLSRF